jgi:arsenate reductase (glutaredoxin)
MSIVIYGIPNCDTIKRTRAWFAEHGAEVAFHDYKKQGVPQAELQRWEAVLGWQALLNRQGTTWRKLSAQQQAQVCDAQSAIQLMHELPSLIKRPVVTQHAQVLVGYSVQAFSSLQLK